MTDLAVKRFNDKLIELSPLYPHLSPPSSEKINSATELGWFFICPLIVPACLGSKWEEEWGVGGEFAKGEFSGMWEGYCRYFCTMNFEVMGRKFVMSFKNYYSFFPDLSLSSITLKSFCTDFTTCIDFTHKGVFLEDIGGINEEGRHLSSYRSSENEGDICASIETFLRVTSINFIFNAAFGQFL